MSTRRFLAALIPALAAGGLAVAALPAQAEPGDSALSSLVQQHLRAGGSWFTAEERTVIERACGYAPGEWDGYELNLSERVLICENGRRVADPEVRRVMRAAAPRISRRVNAVMARDDVRAAINRVAAEASARAMRALARHRH
jgi:hypothetical protein